jgi:acyl dehydratase
VSKEDAPTMTTTVDRPTDLLELAGAALGSSSWIEVTQSAVDQFAEATGDHQWIHTDPVRAKDGPFGGTIAHGYLTLAMLIPMWSELLKVGGTGMAINYGLDRVRFPAPVPVGSRIRATGTMTAVEAVAGGVQVHVELSVECDAQQKPVCVAQAIFRFYD